MSKSDPDSAIFMEDEAADVERKILKKAFCPRAECKDNPIIDYYKSMIFERFNPVIIRRKPEHGGDLFYETFEQLKADYEQNKIDPMDLKLCCASYINEMLQPVRDHF